MKVKIVRHVGHEGPGYLADFLDRRGIAHELIAIDRGDSVPTDLAGTCGLVFMGGPMSVNDPLPWIAPATELIRCAIAADVPVLGHCLGGQLMAKALGVRVTRNPVPEIGWHAVEIVDGDVAKSWLAGLPATFPVYHWHGETFELPAGATHVLRSADCRHQAFALGKHLALQCHVEMTAKMIEEWVERAAELTPARTVQSAAEMLRDVERRTSALHRVADVLYERWIQGLARTGSSPGCGVSP
jgi:GMP synthase-like glutamine amidotransferase